jgi:internalin A
MPEPSKYTIHKERWFQGGKAAVTEVTKQLADKSVVVKGAIAFLEGFSQDVG